MWSGVGSWREKMVFIGFDSSRGDEKVKGYSEERGVIKKSVPPVHTSSSGEDPSRNKINISIKEEYRVFNSHS